VTQSIYDFVHVLVQDEAKRLSKTGL